MIWWAVSDFAFGLKTPEDLLAKLEREIERLKKASDRHSDEHRFQADHAMNCAITARHLCDWAFQYGLVTAAVCSKTFNLYDRELRKDCNELNICRDVANGSKHFILKKPENASIDATRGKRAGGGGAIISGIVGPVIGGLTGALSGSISLYVTEVKLKDGEYKPAAEVFDAVATYFRGFLAEATRRN